MGKAARKARLVQMRGRRALFELLRKRRVPIDRAAPLSVPPRFDGRGPAADAVDSETGEVTWRSKVF